MIAFNETITMVNIKDRVRVEDEIFAKLKEAEIEANSPDVKWLNHEEVFDSIRAKYAE